MSRPAVPLRTPPARARTSTSGIATMVISVRPARAAASAAGLLSAALLLAGCSAGPGP